MLISRSIAKCLVRVHRVATQRSSRRCVPYFLEQTPPSNKRRPRINAGCTHNNMRINAGSQLNAGSNGRAWQCPRGAIRARSQVPAAYPSRVCLMSAKSKRSYDVAMKLQVVDAAETTSKGGSCEAVQCRFNGVYMARALAERNKRRPRINAGPV